MELNGVAPEHRPRWRHGEVSKKDLKEMSVWVAKLLGAGAITPDGELEAYLRKQTDLPPHDKETARVP